MRKSHVWQLLATLAAILVADVAESHHSLSGQFDVSRSFEITGVVARVEWVNPHTYLYVDVPQADGSMLTYRLESLPVAMMRKAGLSKSDLGAGGQPVRLQAHPARSGEPTLGYLLHLHLADGRDIQFARVPGAEQP